MEELENLRIILNQIRIKGISSDILEELLNLLIPKNDNKLLTEYKINKSGQMIASFNPNSNIINVNVKNISEWSKRNCDIYEIYKKKMNPEEIRSYLVINVIAHEVTHAKQYLMAYGKIDPPYEVLSQVYKDIYDLLIKKDSIIPFKDTIRRFRLLLYKANEYHLLLERDASIQSFQTLVDLGEYEKNENAVNLFSEVLRDLVKSGYDKYNGTLEETYKTLYMNSKYKKLYFPKITNKDEIKRYGFPM